ncbi:MAG TPA: hypothetical protein VFV16_02955 [Candidatus Nitrosotalea sp.]|jgi:hypothetical protein|nr:hypothetical protein [Candidatus Nitrosotalea sp.]
MVKIKINMPIGELMIEFTDTADLENQLKNIDFSEIESLLERKSNGHTNTKESRKTTSEARIVEELGTINLLKVSEGGHDATKLAIFLSANKISSEDVKRITGITILS